MEHSTKTSSDQPKTRAGVLLASRGLWFREVPQEDRNERVCKTIMFKKKNGERIAAVVPFLSRVSYRKLKAYAGMDVSSLSPRELRAEGFEPHECAPMLMRCELLVDPDCLTKHPIQTGSGTVGFGIEWHVEDLARLTPYTVFELKEDAPPTR
jgi:prolyl-tRNA editing enzyme YbaK/EbsC (Cys-tRNA(Pro) deacylase)